jgi:hypothetical protein
MLGCPHQARDAVQETLLRGGEPGQPRVTV